MKTRKTKKAYNLATIDSPKPTHEEISRLAYHLYERDGKPDGKHLEHWFNAESMIENQFGSGRDHTEHDFSKTTGEE